MIVLRDGLFAVCSLLIAAKTWYSGFSLLSFVTRFCMLANLQKFGFENLRSSLYAFSGWSVEQPITLLLATSCWREPTRSKQLSTVTTAWLSVWTLRVVVPLSFLRSINLASLFSVKMQWHKLTWKLHAPVDGLLWRNMKVCFCGMKCAILDSLGSHTFSLLFFGDKSYSKKTSSSLAIPCTRKLNPIDYRSY